MTEPVYVYLIEEVGTDLCKIGVCAGDWQSRLSKLQTGNPRKLWVAASILADPKVERVLHKELKEYRLQGEWFAPAELVQAVFDSFEDIVDEGDAATPAMAVQAVKRAFEFWHSDERQAIKAEYA